MELFNLLSEVTIPVFGQTFDVSLNWVGKLIKLLVSGIGVVGVGIIIFSLCLKLIVLPFDVYQRIAMRKQNQKMKVQTMKIMENKKKIKIKMIIQIMIMQMKRINYVKQNQ